MNQRRLQFGTRLILAVFIVAFLGRGVWVIATNTTKEMLELAITWTVLLGLLIGYGVYRTKRKETKR